MNCQCSLITSNYLENMLYKKFICFPLKGQKGKTQNRNFHLEKYNLKS